MAENIPSGVRSSSDAMDRLRVAIENHQKATERQGATTRWLTWVMTAPTILMAVPTVVWIWGTNDATEQRQRFARHIGTSDYMCEPLCRDQACRENHFGFHILSLAR